MRCFRQRAAASCVMILRPSSRLRPARAAAPQRVEMPAADRVRAAKFRNCESGGGIGIKPRALLSCFCHQEVGAERRTPCQFRPRDGGVSKVVIQPWTTLARGEQKQLPEMTKTGFR